jgi:hypothetical protein
MFSTISAGNDIDYLHMKLVCKRKGVCAAVGDVLDLIKDSGGSW